MTRLILILVGIILCVPQVVFARDGFYDGNTRYRGFYWFETKKQEPKKQEISPKQTLAPEAASKSLSARKKELEEAKDIMLEYAYLDDIEALRKSVERYKILEAETTAAALKLGLVWEEANFLNPDLLDLRENPQNVVANKLKRKLAEQERTKQIKEFASEYSLVLFEQEGCPYCTEFRPTAMRFASMYGFVMETVSDFVGGNKQLAALGIKSTPTLVAVKNDGSQAFELIRGLVTITELEENTELAVRLKMRGS